MQNKNQRLRKNKKLKQMFNNQKKQPRMLKTNVLKWPIRKQKERNKRKEVKMTNRSSSFKNAKI